MVLYKLDNGIDHVLIDEAQDTSPEQWEIVKKLTEDFFSGLGASAARSAPSSRWATRNSPSSAFRRRSGQFDINRRHFAQLIAGAKQQLYEVPLITSRRSAPQILDFVDKVFESEAARTGSPTAARKSSIVPSRNGERRHRILAGAEAGRKKRPTITHRWMWCRSKARWRGWRRWWRQDRRLAETGRAASRPQAANCAPRYHDLLPRREPLAAR